MGKHDALSFVVQTLVTSLLYLDYFTLIFFFLQRKIEVPEANMRDHLSGNYMFAMNAVLTYCSYNSI